jgi:hypothetical protein
MQLSLASCWDRHRPASFILFFFRYFYKLARLLKSQSILSEEVLLTSTSPSEYGIRNVGTETWSDVFRAFPCDAANKCGIYACKCNLNLDVGHVTQEIQVSHSLREVCVDYCMLSGPHAADG